MTQFKVGFGTDVGRKRSQNQDSGIARPELGLFVVSDGMGGHRGGETASAMAVEIISNFTSKAESHQDWEPNRVISDALQAANLAVYEKSLNHVHLQGMGTTTTALLFKDHHLSIGHVGDSRCYLFRPNAVWQLTRDHSLVQEKLKAGLIKRSEVKTDRMKNVITRSVGFEKEVEVEIYQMEVQSGDCFLICSDGLSGLMEDLEMLKVIQEQVFEAGNLQNGVNELIATANSHGGDDNITSILVQVL